jgi:hypothetical protein
MARLTELKTGQIFYNVDHSVGKFGRNRFTDVQLVQWLLNLVIGDIVTNGNALSSDPVPEPLNVDGICGSKTKATILWFQQAQLGSGPLDETINSIDATGYMGHHHKFYYTYTMVNLNNELASRFALPDPLEFGIEPLGSELRKSGKKPRIVV